MPEIYSYSHVVEPAEIDDLGHANNVAYVAWLQAAAVAHSAAQGWPSERYRAWAKDGSSARTQSSTCSRPSRAIASLSKPGWPR